MRSCALAATLPLAACSLFTDLGGYSEERRADPQAADSAVEGSADAAPTPASSPCDDPDLVACFSFEGTLADSSAQAQTPRLARGVAFAPGHRGLAGSFDPAEQSRIELDPSPAWDSPAFTLEAWIAPRRIPEPGTRASIIDSELRASMFLYADGRVHCRGGDIEALSAPVPAGTFTHVACTFDRERVRAFTAGVRASDVLKASSGWSNDAPTLIGMNAPSGGDPFDGLIDELRVFRVVRSDASIAADAR